VYEVTVFAPNGEYETHVFDYPPNVAQEERLLLDYPDGCWVDVGRPTPDDGACDTLNFRDEVEYELEPFSLEPFVEEILK